MDSLCFLMKSQLFGEFPNLSNMNSDFPPIAKDSSQRETIPYICDFSRCRLNVRLTACIQPLLRGHKYRVSALFGSWLLAAHANSGFILRKF